MHNTPTTQVTANLTIGQYFKAFPGELLAQIRQRRWTQYFAAPIPACFRLKLNCGVGISMAPSTWAVIKRVPGPKEGEVVSFAPERLAKSMADRLNTFHKPADELGGGLN